MEVEQGKGDKQDASQVIPLKPSDTCLLSSCLKGPQSAAHSRAGAAKGEVPRGAALGATGPGGKASPGLRAPEAGSPHGERNGTQARRDAASTA